MPQTPIIAGLRCKNCSTFCLTPDPPWREAWNLILRRLPVEGVDFLAADVTQQQRGIVRGQASPKPKTPDGGGSPDSLEPD